MPKLLGISTLLSVLFTTLFTALYRFLGGSVYLALAITFGTFCYHLLMRLLAGAAVCCAMRGHTSWHRPWYRPRPFEQKLYARLNVKKWKAYLPTYQPESFSLQKHTPAEIAQASCQAEVTHEVIVILSFLPLLMAIPFGDFLVFLLTSLAAAGFDLLFVIIQRYNRPRLLALAERQKKK